MSNQKRGNRSKERDTEWQERVVQIRRVTKVVKGGKKLSFRAILVIGNEKGEVGVGVGKASDVIGAVKKAAADGRRNLVDGPWNDAIVKEGNADIAIDLDAFAGGGGSEKLTAKKQVSISYGENWKIDDFAIIMVAAQHLEAWKKLFSPNNIAQLPSLVELLKLLDESNHSS